MHVCPLGLSQIHLHTLLCHIKEKNINKSMPEGAAAFIRVRQKCLLEYLEADKHTNNSEGSLS